MNNFQNKFDHDDLEDLLDLIDVVVRILSK